MRQAFTLVELLIVLAILAILSAILFPVLASAKQSGERTVCLSTIRQIGIANQLYMAESDDRMPDRRDIKRNLNDGRAVTWPVSDPRAGWAAVVYAPYTGVSTP